MTSRPGTNRKRRAVTTLAGMLLLSGVYLWYSKTIGRPPRLLAYVGTLSISGLLLLVTTFPPLLLVDKVTRNISKTYRTWVWLTLAIVSVSCVWLLTFLLIRHFIQASP